MNLQQFERYDILQHTWSVQSFSVSVVLMPADAAMEYTEQLPAKIDPKKWRFHGETPKTLADLARSDQIHQQCLKRTAHPRGDSRYLLDDLRETGLFWVTLRKHLSVRDTEFALKVLNEHSGWRDVKSSVTEKQRKEYLRLYDECKHFDPNWVDKEMERRVNEHQIAPVDDPLIVQERPSGSVSQEGQNNSF